MKRLWIAAAILVAVFAGICLHIVSLKGFTEELTVLLEQAEAEAEAGRWEQAGALTEQAFLRWQDRDVYLHVLLRHSDTDQIYADFHETAALLAYQEWGEYSAASARLITHLELLYEAEQLTLKNLF